MKLTRLARSFALAASLGMLPFLPTVVHAEAPFAKVPAPGFHRIALGDFEVTALSDGTVDLPVDQLLHDKPAHVKAALAKAYVSTPVETSVNAYLVNTGRKLILVDTGAGALFGPTLGKLVANLRAAGYTPEQVDDVYLTHLHPDHVGGLAASGAIVFPNAQVHADKLDSDFWLSPSRLEAAPADSKGFFQGAMASLNPYVDAKRYQAFSGSTELQPGLHAIASHGHTAGHTSYLVESKGQKLLLVGDLIHVGAVQFESPSVTVAFDSDAKAAAAARKSVFTQAARDGTMIGASHIQFPGLGHLRAAGTGYQWVPINYTQPR